jgi:hypothetical protein
MQLAEHNRAQLIWMPGSGGGGGGGGGGGDDDDDDDDDDDGNKVADQLAKL